MTMLRTPIPRYRDVSAPAVLAQGFRPFFLAAALWSAAALSGWLHVLFGGPALPTVLAPMDWHIHEMMYGFVAATVAGFLLTAIPNWTGRMPLQGAPLLGLFLLWLAGRIATLAGAWIGAGPAAAIDLAFLAVFLLAVLREIVAGGNWRNLPMAGAVLALLVGNALMHAEAAGWAVPAGIGWRTGIGVMVLLISLVGGRIIPSFTRNWLAKNGAERLPAPFGAVDRASLLATGIAMAAWIGWPDDPVTAGAILVAGLAQAARLVRWQGQQTLSEPLVWILHLAYLWLPVGLVLLAAAQWAPALPGTMGLHALTAGAMGTITLAVMTRATLGHTGRVLQADAATTAIYLAVTLAVVARLAAALLPDHTMTLLGLAGFAWMAAFLGFAAVYGRYLVRPSATAE